MELPLADYVSVLNQASEVYDAAWYEAMSPIHDRSEKLVAQCMRDAGFDYYPVPFAPPDEAQPVPGGGLLVPQLSESRAEVEEFGYGEASSSDGSSSSLSEAEERNGEYFESLNSAAQRAYNFALVGWDGDDESEAPSCVDRAKEQVGAVDEGYREDDSWFSEPASSISSLFSLSFDDGQVAMAPDSLYAREELMALNQEWVTCMLAAGALTDERSRLLRVLGPRASYRIAIGGAGDSPDADLALRLATADFDCRAETDYVMRFAQIQADVERRFIDSHEAQLDRLMATWEQKKK